MKLLYFSWLREKIGLAEEDLTPPANVTDVQSLVEWLRGRGDAYAEALADMRMVRVAVNQEYVQSGHPVGINDEVALFPPVTGG